MRLTPTKNLYRLSAKSGAGLSRYTTCLQTIMRRDIGAPEMKVRDDAKKRRRICKDAHEVSEPMFHSVQWR